MKINLNDSVQDCIVKIAEGNPGAVRVCADILKRTADVDPDSALGGVGHLLALDSLGIYGSKVWMLYKDVCGEKIESTIGMLRAHQLGLVDRSQLSYAIDNRGDGVDVDVLVSQVQERLPGFLRG